MKWMKAGLCTLMMVAMVGCGTVTIKGEGKGRLSRSPDYEDRKTFLFWGLSGEHDVDVRAVCGGGKARQMQSQWTFVDGLLNTITLGIYAPRTAKVWCDRGSKKRRRRS